MEVDIEKYRDSIPDKTMILIGEPGDIVGKEIDENNHLFVIIRNENELYTKDIESVKILTKEPDIKSTSISITI